MELTTTKSCELDELKESLFRLTNIILSGYNEYLLVFLLK